MISSADEAMLMLRKWRDESTLLMLGLGTPGAGGATIRFATISGLDDTRVEFSSAGDSSLAKAISILQGAQFEFTHPEDLSILKDQLSIPIKRLDSALSIRSPQGMLTTLVPLSDAIERDAKQNQ
jgi:hypothetical protein